MQSIYRRYKLLFMYITDKQYFILTQENICLNNRNWLIIITISFPASIAPFGVGFACVGYILPGSGLGPAMTR